VDIERPLVAPRVVLVERSGVPAAVEMSVRVAIVQRTQGSKPRLRPDRDTQRFFRRVSEHREHTSLQRIHGDTTG
jgi:hypothetical protein